jgi:hypothetical protein
MGFDTGTRLSTFDRKVALVTGGAEEPVCVGHVAARRSEWSTPAPNADETLG